MGAVGAGIELASCAAYNLGRFSAAPPLLCPPRHPPQPVAACLSIVAGRILPDGDRLAALQIAEIGCHEAGGKDVG